MQIPLLLVILTWFLCFFFQIKIERNSLFHNRIAVLKMAHKKMLKKLRKKVNKEE